MKWSRFKYCFNFFAVVALSTIGPISLIAQQNPIHLSTESPIPPSDKVLRPLTLSSGLQTSGFFDSSDASPTESTDKNRSDDEVVQTKSNNEEETVSEKESKTSSEVPKTETPKEETKTEPDKPGTTTDIPVKKEEEPELSQAVIEELSNQKLLLAKVKAPDDLFQYLRNNWIKRNYRAAAMAMAFEKSIYTTQAMRQDCLAKWSDIIDRIESIYPRHFPNTDKTDRPYRTVDSTITIEFAKDSNGFWQISPQTLAETDEIYNDIRNDPPIHGDFLTRNVPLWMHQIVWGLSYFRWISLFCGFIFGLIVYWIVQRALHRLMWAYMHVVYKDVKQESRKVWKQVGLIAMAAVWFLVFSRNVANPRAYDIAFFIFVVFVTLMVFLITLKIIDIMTEMLRIRILAKNQYSPENVESLIVPFFSRTLKTLVFCAAIAYIAYIFGWPLAAVISGMGIGGIAVAFAAKETVANLFGSVTVMLDQPFEIGDWIETNGVAGTVSSVGMRSTRIQTSDFGLVTIPNNNLTTAVITNLGRRRNRRFKTVLSLQTDNGIERIEAFCEGIKELVTKNAFTLKEGFSVCLYDLKPGSHDILINIVFVCPSAETENRERAKFLRNVLKLADLMDVRFATSTQSVQMIQDAASEYKKLNGNTPVETGKEYANRLLYPQERKEE